MMDDEHLPEEEPCYVISVAAKLVSLHPQRLRYYERIGLLKPSRTAGHQRLYSQADIEQLRKISRLTEELGVNLAGVEVILNMTDRIHDLQRRLEASEVRYLQETARLQRRVEMLEEAAAEVKPLQIIKVNPDEDASE